MTPDDIPDTAALVERITALLVADPVCDGRVTAETVGYIAGLVDHAAADALAAADAGWMPIESAPKDGTEFQAWVGSWEPRCRFNPDTEAFEVWDRVDYDQDGWDACYLDLVTHWQPLPAAPLTRPAGEVDPARRAVEDGGSG